MTVHAESEMTETYPPFWWVVVFLIVNLFLDNKNAFQYISSLSEVLDNAFFYTLYYVFTTVPLQKM